MKGEMRLTVNGEAYCTEKNTVKELLGEMDIVPERVAVEVNLKVIKRAEYAGYTLQEGDSIEVVYFVGGGEQEEPVIRTGTWRAGDRRRYGR